MKLLYCQKCTDIVRLTKETRSCLCGKCSGRYVDDLNAEITGSHAIPLGVSNSTFVQALKGRPWSGMGSKFEAFVIPVHSPTVKEIPTPKKAPR